VSHPIEARTTRCRVARIITRLNIGGPAIQAIELSNHLRASGFDTCLIYGKLSDGEGDMTVLMPMGDTKTTYVKHLVRPVSPWRDIRAFWSIYLTLCRWQPDIVHTHTAKAGTLGRLAALLYNRTFGRTRPARLVHTYHGHVFEGYFDSSTTKVFLAVERWLGRRTDIVIAISAQIKHDLMHVFRVAREDQIAVIPLGFDLGPLLRLTAKEQKSARATLEIPTDAFVVTTVGRLTEIKQQSLFLQMARLLAQRSPCFRFLLVGDGELREQLERHAAELGIAQLTRFLGWRGDLENVYGATDVFVLTSRNEGTPVALIEAMASGVPAVSTAVGAVRDVVASEQLGVLVPFGDPDQLATAVDGLAKEPARRAEIGAAGRAFVRERFDRQRLLTDVSALYSRLMGFGISTARSSYE
jgi:glycosyltransferase involved in cell wall biosynthesis